MKAKVLTLCLVTSLGLVACGGHDHPKAVDKLAEAEAAAQAKAPTAQEIKFDDYGQPAFGGVGGAAGVKVASNTTAPANASASTAASTTAPAATATVDSGTTVTATTDTGETIQATLAKTDNQATDTAPASQAAASK